MTEIDTISDPLDINTNRALLEDVTRKAKGLLGIIHDIDGTPRGAFACRSRELEKARYRVEEAVALVKAHLSN